MRISINVSGKNDAKCTSVERGGGGGEWYTVPQLVKSPPTVSK